MDNSVSSHTQASTWTSTSGVRRAAALVDAAEDQYLHLAPMATPDQYQVLLTAPVQDGTGGAPIVRSPLSYTRTSTKLLIPSELRFHIIL